MKQFWKIILIFSVILMLVGCAGQPAAPLTEQDLEQRAREFVTQLDQGDFKGASRDFTLTMRLGLSPEKLENTWAYLEKNTGEYQQQGEARIASEDKYQVVYVTSRFGLGALDIKVVFDAKGRIAGLFFQPAQDATALAPEYEPPAYADVNAFHEEEVTVGEGDWQLPGTLTLPNGGGPFPAVVLVHGSGPNDRDESIGPNRVFKDLAWGLASRGIAVLRYEKRTRQYASSFTGEAFISLTVQEETIDDALAAAALLQARQEIDPAQVYVAGHSLGAMLAPRIAAQTDELAGIILLAPAARHLEDLMLEQSTYLAQSDGTLDRNEQKDLDTLKVLVDQIKELPETEKIDMETPILGAAPAYWLDLLAYDPVATAADLSLPVLILQGERDYQVTMTDFGMFQSALSGKDNVIMKSYPTLNHIFIPGEGVSLPAEYQVVSHVDPMVIEDIANFILP